MVAVALDLTARGQLLAVILAGKAVFKAVAITRLPTEAAAAVVGIQPTAAMVAPVALSCSIQIHSRKPLLQQAAQRLLRVAAIELTLSPDLAVLHSDGTFRTDRKWSCSAGCCR
jgi:hypothetical protein